MDKKVILKTVGLVCTTAAVITAVIVTSSAWPLFWIGAALIFMDWD